MVKNRLVELDFLRIIAAVSVIIIHVTSIHIDDNVLLFLMNQSARFAVPMFFILSGRLMLHNDEEISYIEFYAKKVRKLLLPYFLWSVIYTLYTAYVEKYPPDMIALKMIKDLFLGTAFSHFYFFYAILQIYLLYPLLKRWVNYNPKMALVTTLFLSFLCQALLYLDQLNIIALWEFNVGYARFLPVWIFYFVFGMVLASEKNIARINEYVSQKKFWYFEIVLLIICFMALLADGVFTRIYDSSMKPSVFIYSIILFLCFYSVSVRHKKWLQSMKQPLKILSRNCLFVLFFHPLLLSIVRKFYPKSGDSVWGNSLIGAAVTFILVTILSFVLAFLINNLRIASLFGASFIDKKQIKHKFIPEDH